jgi:pheromone shutdown protein TraB
MITLIGVGHVFDIKYNVEQLILERNPSVVCVELDKVRYKALVEKTPRDNSPLVYQLLARFQEKIADKYGVGVGEEMISAINTAKKIGAHLAFIDVEATDSFDKFWKSMSVMERLKFTVGALGGMFVRKKTVERELKRFEKNQDKYMEMFGKEFPTVKRQLIDYRDKYMANAIKTISLKYDDIVAVIGDGHIQGVKKELESQTKPDDKQLEIEIIRLSKVRAMKKKPLQPVHKSPMLSSPLEVSGDSNTASNVQISYTYKED